MEIAKFQNAAAAPRRGLQADISANPIQIKLSKNAHTHDAWVGGCWELPGSPCVCTKICKCDIVAGDVYNNYNNNEYDVGRRGEWRADWQEESGMPRWV